MALSIPKLFEFLYFNIYIMVYTFKITDNSLQAQSLINLLLTFAKDYSFLQVLEEDDDLSNEQEIELDRRYEFYLKNPTVGKSWQEVKANL